MDITSAGPDMWIGKLGHFFLILAFITAIVSAISYWLSAKFVLTEKEISWKKIGRTSFLIHGFSLLMVVGLMFYMMATKKYAYSYVYQHASNDLPFRYLFAAFWEGQEGSTLLWAFWHVVLGSILIVTAKKWESPVLSTISLVQMFLMSMVLGIYFFGHKLGENPFYLLKSSASNAPIFQANPNFVPKDGKGLNELLRNYWMVIHPPTVFLGFAAITVPFGFALGGLYWRRLKDWITPALPWTLLAGAVLGLGVLMGGAWAYEALSFGGFWVWDPVENASLVPWLLIVSALHLMLVFRATGYSGLATFILSILSFIFVAYSTFLTKSGVLGEASVHSFADIGMSGHLVVFILFFWFISFYLLLSNSITKLIYIVGSAVLLLLFFLTKQTGPVLFAFVLLSFAMIFTIKDFPKKSEEEKSWSREFWMFIGALILLLSAIHISAATSVPVYNKLFGTDYSVYDETHFNAVQIWPAILMLLLSAIVLYFAYGKNSKLNIWKQFGIPLIVALVFSILFVIVYNFSNPVYILLLVVGLFSLFANTNYIISVLKGEVRIAGASIAHIGFAILLTGIVISQSKKKIISINQFAKVNTTADEEDLNVNNIMLYEDVPTQMGNYMVTLKEDVEGKLRDGVVVNFKEMDENRNAVKDFNLIPKFKVMTSGGDSTLTADPAIKRGLFQDFFTHLSSISLEADVDTSQFKSFDVNSKDTIAFDRMALVMNKIKSGTTRDDIEIQEGDIAIAAEMDLITIKQLYQIEPVYLIRGNQVIQYVAKVPEEQITVRINEIKPEEDLIDIGIKSTAPFKKSILLKAMIFPMINLVWLGTILMFVGFIMSMIQRRIQAKRLPE